MTRRLWLSLRNYFTILYKYNQIKVDTCVNMGVAIAKNNVGKQCNLPKIKVGKSQGVSCIGARGYSHEQSMIAYFALLKYNA